MEELTRPRRGRPPKNLGLRPTNAEAEGADSLDVRVGEDGEAGAGAPVKVGAHERWCDFVARVTAIYRSDRRLRTVWHPWPEQEVIFTDWGNIAVKTGDYKGQLNTAEFVEI